MSLLAQSRPTRTPDEAQHPYAGEVFTLGTRNSKLAMVRPVRSRARASRGRLADAVRCGPRVERGLAIEAFLVRRKS